jgi:hypothetical protein
LLTTIPRIVPETSTTSFGDYVAIDSENEKDAYQDINVNETGDTSHFTKETERYNQLLREVCFPNNTIEKSKPFLLESRKQTILVGICGTSGYHFPGDHGVVRKNTVDREKGHHIRKGARRASR